MIIELRGVETNNKGAYLMLLSILHHFRTNKSQKEVTFLAGRSSNLSEEERNKLGINNLLKTRRKGIQFSSLFTLIPFRYRQKWQLYVADDVDVLLDASGFAYGDQWSAAKIHWKLSSEIAEIRKNGKKVVLLPQAFGPFRVKEIREEVGEIVSHSNLIFARDTLSLEYIQESFGERKNVYLAPDFTNLLPKQDYEGEHRNKVLIIPNYKIVEKTEASIEDLVNTFKNIVEKIRSRQKEVVFLIHEGVKDEKIALKVNDRLDNKVPIIIEEDAYRQKGIIAEAYAVITGRFHGLVSSLSQGIPSVALSWSHKYQMLLKDYGQEKYMFTIGSGTDLIEEILDAENNTVIRKELNERSVIQKQRSIEMWQKVDDLVFDDNKGI